MPEVNPFIFIDAQPVRFLLQAPLSSSSPSGLNTPTSFEKYCGDLQQRMSGRTPLLRDVLNTFESRVHELQDDLDNIHEQDEDTQ